MPITPEEHAATLLELVSKVSPEMATKYEGREATAHLLTLIEMDVHEYVSARTKLPFVLTVGVTKAGLVIITIVPPDEPVEPLDDVIMTGIKASGTKH